MFACEMAGIRKPQIFRCLIKSEKVRGEKKPLRENLKGFF